jgi:hypothetical protein
MRSAAQDLGTRVAMPEPAVSGLEVVPVDLIPVVATGEGGRMTAGETRTIDLAAIAPPGAVGAVLTVGTWNPDTNGFLTVHACDRPRPGSSTMNQTAGGLRGGQAFTLLSATDTVCVYSSTGASLFANVQGWLVDDDTGLRLDPLPPDRLLDTRLDSPSEHLTTHTIAVPDGAEAVIVNLTALRSTAGGTLTAYACDRPVPATAHMWFGAGETLANAALVPVSAAGTICVYVWTANAQRVEVIVDLNATLAADGTLAFTAASPTRLLDTRIAVGGWRGRHGVSQVIQVPAVPPSAQAVTATLTTVRPTGGSHLRAYPCDAALPDVSSVNGAVGTAIANTITISTAPDQRLCLFASHNTFTLLDLVGWWQP